MSNTVRRKIAHTSIGSLVTLASFSALSFGAQAEDAWQFSATPYLFAPSIKGDASAGRFVNDTSIDVDSGDIFDHLDLGAMVHLETHHQSGWGAIVDYAFMDLYSKTQSPLNPDHQVKADVFQGTLEAFAAYRTTITPTDMIDTYAGIRWWDIDADLELRNGTTNPTVSSGDDWVDPVIGARWTKQWSPDWKTSLDGNVGGFGIVSDFTAALQAVVSYDISDGISLAAGYKALWVDYDNDKSGADHFAYDTVTHGPQIGVTFRF